jgi:integrase
MIDLPNRYSHQHHTNGEAPMRLSDLLNDFEQSLRQRDLSPCTIEAYHWALHDLIAKAMAPAHLVEVEDLTRDVLREWQDTHLEREWSVRSRGLASTAIRQFIKFGVEEDKILDLKLERVVARVKQPEPDPHPIPPDDLAKIKAYLLPYPENPTVVQLRDRAQFCFILATGGRVSEILQVRTDDYESPTVIQKGRSLKTLGVPPEVCVLIRDYLTARTDDKGDLWISFNPRSYGERMTPSQVRGRWHRLSALLGLSYWTTHAIRHTCATELFEAGVKDPVISKHLGHKTPAMLEVYRKVRKEQQRLAVDAMGGMLRLEVA